MMQTGIVLKSTGKWYEVQDEQGQTIPCQVRGKIRLEGRSTTNPVAAGDRVEFDMNDANEGQIHRILPRKNYIIRKSVNLSKEAQIIAANLDLALLFVTTTRPQTTHGFIDRFLITADAYDIPVEIVFHKIDQYTPDEIEEVNDLQREYEHIGYVCHRTSIITGEGLPKLRERIHGITTLISGHSATGKSSMINHLIPSKEIRVGEVSEASNKGQHTTTFAEMHALPGGGFIVDTPGIKGFGLVDIPKEELNHHFVEFFQLLPSCKYHNCMHLNEPGCAVVHAVETGEVSEGRYRSYVSMVNDEEDRSVYR